MLRKLVRFYYRLRYFPRHIFSAVNGIESSVAHVGAAATGLLDAVGALRGDVAGIGRELGTLHAAVSAQGQDVRNLREDFAVHVALMQSANHALAEFAAETKEFHDTTSVALLTLYRRLAATDEAIARLGDAVRHEADNNASRTAASNEAVMRLGDEIRHEANVTAQLDHFLRLQTRVFPSWIWSPAAAARVRSVLSLLRPWAAQGMAKVRVGRDLDGGYVMLDDFAGITRALSLGIADEVSWDCEIAERAIPVLQFDPTVAAPPVEHPHFRFERLRVAPLDDAGSVSVGSILRTRVPEASDTLLLKVDIEGAEWEIYIGLADDVLRRFKQIVCEFHELDRLAEDGFADRARRVFEKLSGTHFVCHVHGNNCANFANVANVPVPQSLEVTFASRAHYSPEPTAETFPTPLDRPNEPNRADLYLGLFRFDP